VFVNDVLEELASARASRRAKGVATEEEVDELLRIHSIVIVGRHTCIVHWEHPPGESPKLSLLTGDAFRLFFEGRFYTVRVDG